MLRLYDKMQKPNNAPKSARLLYFLFMGYGIIVYGLDLIFEIPGHLAKRRLAVAGLFAHLFHHLF